MTTWQTKESASEVAAAKRRKLHFSGQGPAASALNLNEFINQAVDKAIADKTKGKGKGKGEKGTKGKGKGKGTAGEGSKGAAKGAGGLKAHSGTMEGATVNWVCNICATTHSNAQCVNCRGCGCPKGSTKAQGAQWAKEYAKDTPDAGPKAQEPPKDPKDQGAQPVAMGRAAKAEAACMAVLVDIESRPTIDMEPVEEPIFMVDTGEPPAKGSVAHHEGLLKTYLDGGGEDEDMLALFTANIKKAKAKEEKDAKAGGKPLCHNSALSALSALDSKLRPKHVALMARLKKKQEEYATQIADSQAKQAVNAVTIKEETDEFETMMARIDTARAKVPRIRKAEVPESAEAPVMPSQQGMTPMVLSVDTMCETIRARMEATLAVEATRTECTPAQLEGFRKMLTGLTNELIAQAGATSGEAIQIPDDDATSEIVFPWSPMPEDEDPNI